MGNQNGNTQDNIMPYYDLENTIYTIQKDSVFIEASKIKSIRKRDDYISKRLDQCQKPNLDPNAFLKFDFDKEIDSKIIERVGARRLPNLGTLCLSHIGNKQDDFMRFLQLNFPKSIDRLELPYANLNINSMDIGEQLKHIKQNIMLSMSISGLIMDISHFQQLLEFGDHLQQINLSNNTIVHKEGEELTLESKFENLKSLDLEGINLGRRNTEYLVDYLIQTKVVEQMYYLNVYQPGLQDLLKQLDQRLKENGFKGKQLY